MARYHDYQRLIEQTGVTPQYSRWSSHRRELLQQQGTWVDRRYTKEDYQQWWLARFTMREIRQMAGALEAGL